MVSEFFTSFELVLSAGDEAVRKHIQDARAALQVLEACFSQSQEKWFILLLDRATLKIGEKTYNNHVEALEFIKTALLVSDLRLRILPLRTATLCIGLMLSIKVAGDVEESFEKQFEQIKLDVLACEHEMRSGRFEVVEAGAIAETCPSERKMRAYSVRDRYKQNFSTTTFLDFEDAENFKEKCCSAALAHFRRHVWGQEGRILSVITDMICSCSSSKVNSQEPLPWSSYDEEVSLLWNLEL